MDYQLSHTYILLKYGYPWAILDDTGLSHDIGNLCIYIHYKPTLHVASFVTFVLCIGDKQGHNCLNCLGTKPSSSCPFEKKEKKTASESPTTVTICMRISPGSSCLDGCRGWLDQIKTISKFRMIFWPTFRIHSSLMMDLNMFHQ